MLYKYLQVRTSICSSIFTHSKYHRCHLVTCPWSGAVSGKNSQRHTLTPQTCSLYTSSLRQYAWVQYTCQSVGMTSTNVYATRSLTTKSALEGKVDYHMTQYTGVRIIILLPIALHGLQLPTLAWFLYTVSGRHTLPASTQDMDNWSSILW